MDRLSREERRRLWQTERLVALRDDELREVGRELYWRGEQFGSNVRMVVNDELRRRGMQTIPNATGDLDYG